MALSVFPIAISVDMDGSTQKIDRRQSIVSPAGSVRYTRNRTAVPAVNQNLNLTLWDDDIRIFVEWFTALRGRLLPFWLPSYQRDMIPLAAIAADALEFDIQGRSYTDFEFPHLSRRPIFFYLSASSMVLRFVTGAVDNGDGTETITIDEAIGAIFTQKRGTAICFARYVRMADDKVKIEFEESNKAKVEINVLDLPFAPQSNE